MKVSLRRTSRPTSILLKELYERKRGNASSAVPLGITIERTTPGAYAKSAGVNKGQDDLT